MMMRCASNDRQRKDDFIIHFAINDKATRLQVIESMPDMMQLKKKSKFHKACKTNSSRKEERKEKKNKKRNSILQCSLRLMILKKTTNKNALADV